MTWKLTMLIGLGGALGTLARYAVSLLAAPYSQSLPWGTVAINVVGSFVIGFVGTSTLAAGRHPWPEAWRLFVMVGVCGGFTTFSAFSLQTFELLRGGAVLRACVNVAVSVLACVAAVALGHALAARLNDGAPAVAQISAEEDG